MVVPCNHTVLYSKLMSNVFDISLNEHCDHNHDHGEEDNHHHNDSNHHHSCTPFCACGIAHFVLDAPPFQLAVAKQSSDIYQTDIIQATIWAPTSTAYKSLMVYNIWNPPRKA